jgi:hypothetical protein
MASAPRTVVLAIVNRSGYGEGVMCDPASVTVYQLPNPQTMFTSTCRGISRQLAVATTRRSAVRLFSRTSARSSDAIFVVSRFLLRTHPHKRSPSGWTASGHRVQQPKGSRHLFVFADILLTRCLAFRLPSSLLPTTSHGPTRSFPTTHLNTRKRPSFLCSTLHNGRIRDGQASAS